MTLPCVGDRASKTRTRQPSLKSSGSHLPFTHLRTQSVKKGRHMQHYGDNFVLVVPDAQPLHTEEHPFCGDPTCPCSEDKETLTELDQAVRDGLITLDDATRIIKGKTV